MTMSIPSNKRKATDVKVGDSDLAFVEVFAKNVQTLNDGLRILNKNVETLNQRVGSLEMVMNEIREKVVPQTKKVVPQTKKVVPQTKKVGDQDRVKKKVRKSQSGSTVTKKTVTKKIVTKKETNRDESYMTMFNQLREYRRIHGHCKVPQKFAENPKLGVWVKQQREFYNNTMSKNGKRKLSPEKIGMLESVGFYWGKKYEPAPSWEAMFDQLKSWKQRTGNCDVPFDKSRPSQLAKWVRYQQNEYRLHKKGCNSQLTEEQLAQLNNIGMGFEI